MAKYDADGYLIDDYREPTEAEAEAYAIRALTPREFPTDDDAEQWATLDDRR